MHCVEQSDAQAFRLEGPSTVQGLFPRHVVPDRGVAERPEAHPGDVKLAADSRTAIPGKRHGGQEINLAPAGCTQLLNGARLAPRFTQYLPVQDRQLVGPDDQGVRLHPGHDDGLFPRETRHQITRGFTRARCLVDAGGANHEAQP